MWLILPSLYLLANELLNIFAIIQASESDQIS